MTDDLQSFFRAAAEVTETKMARLFELAAIEPPRLLEAIQWSVFGGGKRFRPALMLAVGEVFAIPLANLLSSVAAVEMIHTYSLIHDDLPAMDDDDLRRGRATCHRKFDEATAILAGDALQVLAFKAIAEDDGLSAETRRRLTAGLANSALQMVSGQQMDLENEGQDAGADVVKHIHRKKTGALIRYSAEAVLIIGGVKGDEGHMILSFAEQLGLMYQVTDDLLDVTQSTAALGKTSAKDVSSQKVTFPGVFGKGESIGFLNRVRGEALELLAQLDRDTTRLAQIADFVVERRS